MSPLQKGYVTAETRRSQRKMPSRSHAHACCAAHPSFRFQKFFAPPASLRCVFAAKSFMHPGLLPHRNPPRHIGINRQQGAIDPTGDAANVRDPIPVAVGRLRQ
jgi:hypothetical protein